MLEPCLHYLLQYAFLKKNCSMPFDWHITGAQNIIAELILGGRKQPCIREFDILFYLNF